MNIVNCEFNGGNNNSIQIDKGAASGSIVSSTFTNSLRTGIVDKHTEGHFLYDDLHFDQSGTAIFLQTGSIASATVTNCVISNSANFGIDINEASNIEIASTVVSNANTTGFSIRHSSRIYVRDSSIAFCGSILNTIHSFFNEAAGIYIGPNSQNILIENCLSSDNVGAGISIANSQNNMTILNSYFDRNANNGVRAQNCASIRLIGGTVNNNTNLESFAYGAGINIQNSSGDIRNVTITQNDNSTLNGNGG